MGAVAERAAYIEMPNQLDFLGQVVRMNLQVNGAPNHFELTTDFLTFPPKIATCQAERKDLQETIAYPSNIQIQRFFNERHKAVEVDHRQPNAWTMLHTQNKIACVIKTDNYGNRIKLDVLAAGCPKSLTDYKIEDVAVEEGLAEEGITVAQGRLWVPRNKQTEMLAAVRKNIEEYQALGGTIPSSHEDILFNALYGERPEDFIEPVDYNFHEEIWKVIEPALPSLDVTMRDPKGNVVEELKNKKAIFHQEGLDMVEGLALPDEFSIFDAESFHNPDKGRRENLNRDIAFLTLEQIRDVGQELPISDVLVSHHGELREERLDLKPASLMRAFAAKITPFI